MQVDTNRAHNTVGHASSSCGRVRSLAYSPFFDDLLLAVADSGFLIWQDRKGELGQQPLLESRFSDVLYTTGCWSPTKPGAGACSCAAGFAGSREAGGGASSVSLLG